MRYECLQLARQHGAAFLQLYLRCPAPVAISRNAKRGQADRVPDAVIFKMANTLEEPDSSKYAWEMNSLTIDTGHVDLRLPVIR